MASRVAEPEIPADESRELEALQPSETRLATRVELPHARRSGESDALFELLVESVRDYAIFMLDAKGYVATWNVGARRIKGYTAAEIVGQHFSKFYPVADVRAGKCEYELEIAAREGRFEEEGWRVRKDGTRFWANVLISSVRNSQDELLGFAKVTRDLTERKKAQEEQAARLAAEEANRAKDEFLAMLGHELRNPLAPIVTALQLMQLRGDSRTSREQQIIERQVQHMIRLVDDLLDVSRITRGTLVLKLPRLDIRESIAKAVELASPLFEQKGHHLQVEVPPEAVLVEADDARLTQVLANVLVNAARYTDAGGHISIAVELRDGQVYVLLRDDGRGIAPELLPKIFDLFVQGSQTAERSMGGLGIGLTLARRLIDKQGGSISAESAGLGQGSTFTVRLPVLEMTDDAVAPESRRLGYARVSQPLRVLVVDDNEDAAVMLGEVLQSVGHEVQLAMDAAEAIRVVRRFSPEVAILDIGLPVMDGYTLALQLRAELGELAPRLIAVTGYGQGHDRERSMRSGFSAHLVKPVDLQRLLELVSSEP